MPDLPTVGVDQSYGTECGFTRIVPAYRDSLEAFVKQKDETSLRRWLNSGEAIKAVYAVEGIHRTLDEITMSNDDMKMIQYYKHEEVEITCCGSGIPQKCTSKEVLKKFGFLE